MSVVLMYHALFPGEDTSAIDAENLPYAVAERDFAAQLDALLERRGSEGVTDVVLTFDDGHASGHDIALPHLLERGLRARFFVTSDFVGRRPGFCDARHVAALAEAGMSVGSHGTSHAFFDDLDDEAATAELEGSRARLRAMGGGAVDAISFPGGRWSARTLELAERAGYRALFGSTPDEASADTLARGHRADGTPVPRVPIRRSTTLTEFTRIVDADPAWFRRRRAVQGAKRAARTVLGNKIYHGLYKFLH